MAVGVPVARQHTSLCRYEDAYWTGKSASFTSMAQDYFKVPEAQRKHNDKGVHTFWLPQDTSVDRRLLFLFVAWLRAIIECDLTAIVVCGVSSAWRDFGWICVFYVVLVYVRQWARRDQFSRQRLEPSAPHLAFRSHPPCLTRTTPSALALRAPPRQRTTPSA